MAANLIQNGKTMTWNNNTDSDVSSGDLVNVNGTFGVALVDIAKGASGILAMEGVFEIQAINTAAIAQGNPVYADASTGKGSPTAEDQKYIGICWESKAEAGTTVKVKLGAGYHPIVNQEA
jgi:predicted RecA/RadA family phage recombinase